MPSPVGGFASKLKIEAKIDNFMREKDNGAHAKPAFEAKPPEGEGIGFGTTSQNSDAYPRC